MPERVRDIMETKLVTISASERLSMVEDIMRLGRVRHMPVVQGGKLVGVVSERDLLRASLSVLSEHRDAERRMFLHVVEISRVMSAPPDRDRARRDDSRGRPAHGGPQDRLPARGGSGDELLGMVTETDVLRWVAGVPPPEPRQTD